MPCVSLQDRLPYSAAPRYRVNENPSIRQNADIARMAVAARGLRVKDVVAPLALGAWAIALRQAVQFLRAVAGVRRHQVDDARERFILYLNRRGFSLVHFCDSRRWLERRQHRMTAPLSNDLRERVVAAIEAGESCRSVAAVRRCGFLGGEVVAALPGDRPGSAGQDGRSFASGCWSRTGRSLSNASIRRRICRSIG